MMLDRERARLDLSLERLRGDQQSWRDAASVTQSLLWLTDEELREVTHTLFEVAMRYADRLEDASARPAGARLCSYLGWGVPTYDVLPATPDADQTDDPTEDPS